MAVDPAAQLGLAQPVATRVGGTGTNRLSYKLAGGETMLVEAISVDADASAAFGGSISARFLSPSGDVIAESSSGSQLPGGSAAEVTFAPFLPDTVSLGGSVSAAQLQTGLVLTELPGGSTVEIIATDTLVVLTEARIWASGAPSGFDDRLPPPSPVYLTPVATDVEGEPV